MSCPASGPCLPYVTELDLCCLTTGGAFGDPCLTNGEPVPQAVIDNALMAASEVLWTSSGRQFGKCTVKIRPCQKLGCGPCGLDSSFDYFSINGFGWGAHPWTPALENGVWTNLSCNKCGDTCGCKALCEIPLPYPTCCIDEVKVGGVVVPPAEYRVDEFKRLVRLTDDCWPKCQNLLLEDTEPDTFSVTVTYGREVPELIKLATASLACEFIKACVNQPCALPQRIQSISRQGITIGMLDPMAFLDQGHTGIYIVDLAINRYNPKGLLKQASVYNPDQGKRWTRTNTGPDCT